MGRPLRVAIIGAGDIAGEHLGAWDVQPDAVVQQVVDIDSERAQRLASAFDVARWTTDYEALVEDSDVDVADICLPPRLHADATVAFLQAGKHVLLEKPFVTSFEEAARVLAADEASTATLMVAENWPFASATSRVMRLIENGRLGDLYMLRAHHESALYVEGEDGLAPKLRASTAVGGYTMSAGIHSINLAAHLMGGFESVFAYSTDQPDSPAPFVERDAVLAARFSNGGVGVMNFTGRSLHRGERRLSFGLFGSQGVVEFDILRGCVTSSVDEFRNSAGDQPRSMGFNEEIAHFCACIAEGSTPLTSAREQLGTLATVLAVYRSMYERREVRPAQLLAEAGLLTEAGP